MILATKIIIRIVFNVFISLNIKHNIIDKTKLIPILIGVKKGSYSASTSLEVVINQANEFIPGEIIPAKTIIIENKSGSVSLWPPKLSIQVIDKIIEKIITIIKIILFKTTPKPLSRIDISKISPNI